MYLSQIWIVRVARIWYLGVLDALDVLPVIQYIREDAVIAQRTLYTFGLSLVVVALGLVEAKFTKTFGDSTAGMFFVIAFKLFVSLPIFVLIYVLNALWWGDISSLATNLEKAKNNLVAVIREDIDIALRIYNEVVRVVLGLGVVIQVLIIKSVVGWVLVQVLRFPARTGQIVTEIITLVHKSFWLSFLCFEYKWGTDSILERNISFFESHISYFSGFGAVFVVIEKAFSPAITDGIELALFAFFLMLTTRALPVEIKYQSDTNTGEVIEVIERKSALQHNYNPSEKAQFWNYFYLGKIFVGVLEFFSGIILKKTQNKKTQEQAASNTPEPSATPASKKSD
jgi:hypothetical protein